LPQQGVDVVRQHRDEGQYDQQAGEKKDGSRGFSQVLLQSPAEGVADRFFAVQNAEKNVVHQVCYHEHAAEEEDDEEPAVPEVKGRKCGNGSSACG